MIPAQFIGLVGLGTMGLGIAQVFAAAGFTVIGTDGFGPARANAAARMAEALAARVRSGKLAQADCEATLARFTVASDLHGLAPCALIIEAIIENLEEKQALFAQLEVIIDPQTVLASNTSSIRVHQIAQGLQHPERALALHFFNPAPAMKLVELAGHAGTSPAAAAIARAVCEAAGKVVIDCPDSPGFIVNRCARPYYGEALALLDEGRSAAEIDGAMRAAGYPLGPFALIDLIGADVNLAATTGLYDAMAGHPRYLPFPALRAQVAKGDLGRKTGRGFVFPDAGLPAPPDAAAIALRIESTLANEAHWLLAQGGVTEAGIDTAMRLGLNFPPGPFEAMQRHGRAAVLVELARLRRLASPQKKPRYDAAPGLEPS